MKKLSAILFVVTVFAAFAYAQEPVSGGRSRQVGISELYLAKDNGNGKAGSAATGFVTTDVPIYCVVQLDAATPVTVKMNLVAVDVQGVKPETRVVSTTYTTKENQSRVNFTGRPAGKYRVDIFVGDAAPVSRAFTIERPSGPKPSAEGLAAPRQKTPRVL